MLEISLAAAGGIFNKTSKRDYKHHKGAPITLHPA
jgi:hypothetical protein